MSSGLEKGIWEEYGILQGWNWELQQAAMIHQWDTGPGLLAQKGRVWPAAEFKATPNVVLRFVETMASSCAGLENEIKEIVGTFVLGRGKV